ncbi:MAG: bifunctional phosphoribosylaminoimidazolecarboxamide formyltransferase/inosine monophosphate cyclohydrolase [Acidobacteria bacterium]|nr:MAG: bifunctional phosphoribosylaminoimidazolecarboxamide formyltransferase/inosine monophosphate cyclohydrolase [Acidobacteriota bacterium]PYU60402.1 MAG: bifunctional phosphoribosylaminoimidazolecarboxamide formyltransferase/inosine monophosphate cyclohydrolase [Acidobacteriota bacterium]PYU77182.1 MAG: bifunctional phosphoribosylaminoimidazolecarboxamide formyltransferase/inosine monophosphate cyclohydrolase [Acidobacteriota bacterium]
MAVRRALISVFDKTGVVEFAKRLAAQKIEILSTGGTAKLLREAGIAVRDVSDFTGWPEMLGGRVKTLHPKVHGGLLFRRGHTEDEKQAAEYGIAPIDLVAVNLYPFEATAAKAGLTATELIENIDIGGPTMLRSAAKNFESVTVVTDAADFERVARQIESAGETTLATRLELARKVFARTSRYDGMIATELERLSAGSGRVALEAKPVLPEFVHIVLRRQQELRYGENPHQAAALYVPAERAPLGLAAAKQLQGKELSYNNLVDLEAARSLAAKFKNPAAVIIKHNNPCGAAERETLVDAYLKALACDPVSAFGGVLAFNRAVDTAAAEEVAKLFVECIAAPGFADRAKEIFAAKKNLRLLELPAGGLEPERELQLKRILGGMLVQQPDLGEIKDDDLRMVTKRAPTAEEMHAMRFAWKVAKHVKSNAIVFAKDGATLGVGAGQMSRVDSVRIAVMKAQSSLAGTVVASDAFFPFADGVEEAAKAGATAVIQPGGSVRDAEVIAAADRLSLAMVFTGMRHFLH